MDINEIAKTMTKEEFINCLSDECPWLDILGQKIDCPHRIDGLNAAFDNNGGCENCRECWINSIKDIIFKDELVEQPKTMNILELLQFAQLKENQGKRVGWYKGEDAWYGYYIKDKYIFEFNDAPFNAQYHIQNNTQWRVIEEPLWKEVDVISALKSKQEGKEVKCEVNNEEVSYESRFINISSNDTLSTPLVNKIHISLDAILNGKWYIKE